MILFKAERRKRNEKIKKSADRHDVAMDHCLCHHDMGCKLADLSVYVFDQYSLDLYNRMSYEKKILSKQKDLWLQ